MPSIPIPDNEAGRIAALSSYHILDTLPEKDFDELTLLASEICQTPIALISLLDDKRQWFKSAVGTDETETLKELAFCAHTIVSTNDIMVVQDARRDDRFATNPLVTGDPNIVFYAGVPLVNEDGYALGSLCVLDRKPKALTPKQVDALRILGKQVLAQLELRRKLHALENANEVLSEANTFIQKFASTAAHDIKNPLSSILLTSQALQMRLKKVDDTKSSNLVEMNITAAKRLLTLLDEMLAYSKVPASLLLNHQCIELNKVLDKIADMIEVPPNMQIVLPAVPHTITCSAVAVEQIFINLLTNAIRYNDKEQGIVRILFREDDDYYSFKVSDNGMGIAPHNLEKIFDKNTTLNIADRFNQLGTGIGLSTVKSLVEKLQGRVKAESVLGEGTTFTFSIKK